MTIAWVPDASSAIGRGRKEDPPGRIKHRNFHLATVLNSNRSRPDRASHIRAVWSTEPLNTRWPSGLNDTHRIRPWCWSCAPEGKTRARSKPI